MRITTIQNTERLHLLLDRVISNFGFFSNKTERLYFYVIIILRNNERKEWQSITGHTTTHTFRQIITTCKQKPFHFPGKIRYCLLHPIRSAFALEKCKYSKNIPHCDANASHLSPMSDARWNLEKSLGKRRRERQWDPLRLPEYTIFSGPSNWIPIRSHEIFHASCLRVRCKTLPRERRAPRVTLIKRPKVERCNIDQRLASSWDDAAVPSEFYDVSQTSPARRGGCHVAAVKFSRS